MNPKKLLKLTAGLLTCLGCAAPAFAQVTLSVDMDTASPGIQFIRSAAAGETFAVDLVLTVGPGGVSSYGVSAFFDTNELFLALPASANASPLPGGLSSFSAPVEATPFVYTFNAATFGAGPVSTSFTFGTINFTVQPGGAIGDALADVTLGLYSAGVDGLFDSVGAPVVPTFADGYVGPPVPEPGAGMLLAGGMAMTWLLTRRRSR